MKIRALTILMLLSICTPAAQATQSGRVVGWGRQVVEVDLSVGFTAIAAGRFHSLALRADGSIAGWGHNASGQATPPSGTGFTAIAAGRLHSLALRADGSIVTWGQSIGTPPSGTGFKAIAAGEYHSLALCADGSIVGWGRNDWGQATPPSGTDFMAIAAGAYHSLALRTDGSIAAWGWNSSGQTTPPSGTGFTAIAAGERHSLALRTDGSIAPWGDGYYYYSPYIFSNDFVAIAAGTFHSLALRADGSIVGWGRNNYGQATPPSGMGFVAIAAGYEHSLALKADGSIVGWGDNSYGQATLPPVMDFTAIAAGGYHSLALRADGSIVGWGGGTPGYTSYGQATPPSGTGFKAIAAGEYHSLALRADGSIVGWGRNNYGQATPPSGMGFVAIAAGAYHSLALRADGSIVGWGSQSTPYSGTGFTAIAASSSQSVALRADGSIAWSCTEGQGPDGQDFTAVAAGGRHCLALRADGSIVAWGDNTYGQATPPSGTVFKAIAAGGYHSLALRADGSIVGWGQNTYGKATPPSGTGFTAIAAGVYHSLALLDGTAPSPDPMTWAISPYAISPTSISMTATTATDSSGVEYYFACTGGGGHDSGWQDSTTYIDTALAPCTTYTYAVKARDKSLQQNETAWSQSASAMTSVADDINTFALWHGDYIIGTTSPDDTSISRRTAIPLVVYGQIGLSGGQYGQALDFGANGRQMATPSATWPAANTSFVDAPGNEIKLDGWFYIPNVASLPIPGTAGGSGAAMMYAFQICTSSAGGTRCSLVVNHNSSLAADLGQAMLVWQKTNNGSTISIPLYNYVLSTGQPYPSGAPNALNLTGKWLHIVTYAQYASPAPAWDPGYNRTRLEVSDPGTGTTYAVEGANSGILTGSGSNVWVGHISGKTDFTPYRGWRGLIDELKLSTRVHAPMVAYGPMPADGNIESPSANLVASWHKAAPYNPADSITQDVWVGPVPTFDPDNLAGWTKVATAITGNTADLGEVFHGNTYYWKVDSIDSGTGATTPSAIWSFTAMGVPAVPAGISATDGSYMDNVRVTWNVASGADGYEIWRNTTNNSMTASIMGTNTGAANVTFDDTTAVADTTYWYWVKAFNTVGYSGFGSPDSGYASRFVADFLVVAKRRISRTMFDYDCKVVLTNNSPESVRVAQFEVQSAPANMSIVDASVSEFDDIAGYGTATSEDTCTFRVDRSQAIDASQVTWRVNYEVLESGQTMQLTSFSELNLEQKVTGDATGNGAVDSADLALLAEQWLSEPGIPSADIAPELPDGVVNLLDYAVLAGHWLEGI